MAGFCAWLELRLSRVAPQIVVRAVVRSYNPLQDSNFWHTGADFLVNAHEGNRTMRGIDDTLSIDIHLMPTVAI